MVFTFALPLKKCNECGDQSVFTISVLGKNGILQAFALWLNSQWVKGEYLILGVNQTAEHRAIARGQGEENHGVFLGVSGGQALEKVSQKLRILKLIFLQ